MSATVFFISMTASLFFLSSPGHYNILSKGEGLA